MHNNYNIDTKWMNKKLTHGTSGELSVRSKELIARCRKVTLGVVVSSEVSGVVSCDLTTNY